MVLDASPKAGGGAQASPSVMWYLLLGENHLSYFAATGTACAGVSTDVLFTPTPAPESGRIR